jgi:hypothetical protein
MIDKPTREAAIRYAINCVDCNPDAGFISKVREFFEDDGIAASKSEIEDIAFEAMDRWRMP